MLQELFSETGIKIYSFLSVFIFVPVYKWWKNIKKERESLVNRVTRLEEKMDTEIVERKNMDKKLDTMMEVLTEVRINTAVNAAKIVDKD